jgi:chromosome segregation protein
MDQAASVVQTYAQSLEQLRTQAETAKAQIGSSEGQMGSLEQEAEALQTVIKSEKQALQSEEAVFERISDESRKAAHTLSLLAVKEHESQIQERRLTQEIRQAKELQERLQGEEQTQEVNLDAVEKRLERLLDAQRQAEDETALGRQSLEQCEKELEAESGRLKRREKELQELIIQKAHHTSFLEALTVELKEGHGLDVELHRDTLPALDLPLPEAEQQVRQLKEMVERGSHVNMTSIDEFEHQKARADSLEVQLSDLRTSQKELQQIITELDEESRRLFSDTFAIIRAKFQEIFQILFRGGEADLQLTDEGDVLSAGIEIVAKPPGKQMRSIHLMSGGEKCLTALALLFALFEVKPAPFCLLDEIDAPLDDSNVDRFASMLRHFVDRCQFIVITHNKCTMAVADVLVGVSMQEKGVSKVLTFDFARHEAALSSE